MADEYAIPPHERDGGYRRGPVVHRSTDAPVNLSFGSIETAEGLTEADAARVAELVEVFNRVSARNRRLMRYYNADVTLPEVNLGFALDERLAKSLDVRCGWPAKAVSCLVTRSVFDGYVASDPEVRGELHAIARDNALVQAYNRARYSEAALGVTFATLSWNEEGRARVRFHTAQTATAVWDGTLGRLAYGLAVIDSAKYNDDRDWLPSVVNVYTDNHIVVLTRYDSTHWRARYVEHGLGRPPMVALVNEPTDRKPFGKSRVSATVMSITDEALRTMGRMSMSAELFTYPQKYVLGLTDDLVKDLDSFTLAMNKVVKLGTNPETGQNADIKQFSASSMEPHLATLRSLATLFAGETACPVSELGVITDNPSSAEAILASKEALLTLVEAFNACNQAALYTVAELCLALNLGTSVDDLPEEYHDFEAHFKSPTLASLASQTDAVVKIASVDPSFAGTDVFYSLLGLDSATIRQIQDQKTRNAGQAMLADILKGGGNGDAT